jgi:hypothetical protein
MDLDYNTRLAAIQRNEKLAQIMQQQAFQPIDIQSYQGIQAPISPLSGLAKVLQAYMGAKGNSDEERIKLNQEAKAEAQQMLSGLQDRPASPGRAAVMGSPEVQARPATSFTPMGSDFEDNPNLQVAPSGNVETPAVAFQPAVAPQAAIPAQPAMQLTNEEKNKKLVEIMMGQNPYASPVAKLMYESLEKQNTGPLAEYRLAQQQGYKGTMKDYQIEQAQAKRPITNVNMPSSMAPIYVEDKVTGEKLYIQANNKGTVDLGRYKPVKEAGELEITKLMTLRDSLPKDSPDRKVVETLIEKAATQSFAPSSSVKNPITGEITQTAPTPEKGTVNVIIDGKVKAIPIEDFNRLNAERIKSETTASEGVKNTFEFVTVDNPDGKGGKILMSKSAVAAKEAAGTPVVSEADKKVTQGRSVLELANEAKKYLPQASSGAISKLFTLATDALGFPTNKSAADAQLNVISAGLTSNVPRFEGPQGVADVVLYKQAASDVGNAGLPYQTRLQALNVVIDLNKKYAVTPEAYPEGSVRRITPRTGRQ